ncbi:MAG: triose-phosphate isomerase [Acidimicrobiaceae bacterium]|nr:triose-phosphate isomerase [Acidimicrobiaceae bacterium]
MSSRPISNEPVYGNRKPLISGNWKMNHNHFEAIRTIQKLAYALNSRDYDHVDVSVHPPFTDLRSVQTVLQADDVPVSLGAQNVHMASHGAFTGEIAPPMLAKLNVEYVIVGHSERRELFGETDEVVVQKAKAVLAAGMTPIVCVGETLEQRQAGEAESTVSQQVSGSLAGLPGDVVAGLVIAYEPVWAIGTGVTATPDDAQQMCAHIRTLARSRWGDSAARQVRIQYGGSVKGGNAPELMAQPDVDGALVGGASLDAEEFARIVNFRLYQA